jgi:hypothetical protein
MLSNLVKLNSFIRYYSLLELKKDCVLSYLWWLGYRKKVYFPISKGLQETLFLNLKGNDLSSKKK